MNYQQEALRTKSDIFNLNELHANALLCTAGTAMLLNNIAAATKKSIFYGKGFPDLDSFEPAYRSVEDSVREICPEEGKLKEGLDLSVLDADTVHGILGIFTEACELMELMFNAVKDGKPIDRAKLVNELGDVSWYHALASHAVNATLDEVHEKNIVKLKTRYPDKFTSEAACSRDEDKEYVAMENAGN